MKFFLSLWFLILVNSVRFQENKNLYLDTCLKNGIVQNEGTAYQCILMLAQSSCASEYNSSDNCDS